MSDEMLYELFARETARVAAREEAACAGGGDETITTAYKDRMETLCARMKLVLKP